MPKLFDEFDLDLQKVDQGINLYNGDNITMGGDCVDGGSGSSLCGISTWTINCFKSIFSCDD